MEKLKRGDQNFNQCRHSFLYPVFGRFQVFVAKIMPEELIEILGGLTKMIAVEIGGGGFYY